MKAHNNNENNDFDRTSKTVPTSSIPVTHFVRYLSIWTGLVLIFISLLASFLVLEAGLRFYLDEEQQNILPHFGISEDLQRRIDWHNAQRTGNKQGSTSYPSHLDTMNQTLGWRVRKNINTIHTKPGTYKVSVSTNDYGLRGKYPKTLNKGIGILRAGIFGCSQTFGETVNDDETYVENLNNLFPGMEFLNFGVRGYGSDQMLLYHEQTDNLYELDVVILAFAFYHMRRNAASFLFYAKPYFSLDKYSKLHLHGTPVPLPQELLNENVFLNTWQQADRSVALRWIWNRVRNLRYRLIFWKNGKAWQLTQALITRFVQTVRAQGKMPVLLQIDESHEYLESDLKQLADTLGVDLVNLGPVFRDADAAGISYKLPRDEHWNATGHAIVARELRTYLCQNYQLSIDCNK